MAGILLTSYLSFAISAIFLIAGLYNLRKGGGIEPGYFFFISGIFLILGVVSLLYFLRFF